MRKSVELKRREAEARQLVYNDKMDAAFKRCVTSEGRVVFLKGCKQGQRLRLMSKFSEILEKDGTSNIQLQPDKAQKLKVVSEPTKAGKRLSGDEQLSEKIFKLTGGNPGSVAVLAKLYEVTPAVDPYAPHAGLTMLMDVDHYGLYDARMHFLFVEVCGKNIIAVAAMIKSLSLGLIKPATMHQLIENKELIDTTAVIRAVQDKLPLFAKEKKSVPN